MKKTLKVAQVFNPEYLPNSLDDNGFQMARYVYKVEKITNSITPNVNDILKPDQLNVYCEDDDWSVTID